jgi:hypothetical protein
MNQHPFMPKYDVFFARKESDNDNHYDYAIHFYIVNYSDY